MRFNSLQFLLFFPLVTTLYYLLPHRFRWALLLVASCFFYMAFIPEYILILAAIIAIDYYAGLRIEKSAGKGKKFWLITSISATCLVLFVFKYFDFFNTTLSDIAGFFGLHYPEHTLKILLPLGLSFHTFQSLSYVIEVYRGRQAAERHFGIYALYVLFFPQLIAGPIERPQNLLHQFKEVHAFDYKMVTDGLKLMTWGLLKKVVIADRLAIVVNQVYEAPTEYGGMILIVATIFFAFQIYCDFSGYSDIAIGAAQVMGFTLSQNFRRPYFSKSVAEFWTRWHISLSSWFRDYLYIPLGGNRVSTSRWQVNILVTLLISGLWHGANWTYIVWGAINGAFIVLSASTKRIRDRIAHAFGATNVPGMMKCLQITVTFSLITFAWIYFRSATLSDAWYITTHLFSDLDHAFTKSYLAEALGKLSLSNADLAVSLLLILFLESIHLLQRKGRVRDMLADGPIWFRWCLYYGAILCIIFLGVFRNSSDFIYFQF